ncbi:cysteine desulfurase family protein [Bacillaceae bacterium W0354]
MKRIYLDHAATTPIHQDVIITMQKAMENHFGNPSSIHHFGRESRKILDEARQTMASSINADHSSIIFTSGGTEANNLAIFGVVNAYKNKGNHIITSQIEHHAVLHPCEQLEKEGYEITYLPVDESGIVSVNDVKEALREDTILVTIMSVNNETGMKQPIKEIGELLKDHQAIFHTDAVQAYGVEKIDVNELNVDLMTVSSHKIYGPKGIGFLYKQADVKIQQRLFGGEQERTLRSGTENTIAIEGFSHAVKLLEQERNTRVEHYQQLFNQFISSLQKEDVQFSLNGDIDMNKRVPNIVNISFPNTDVEKFLTNLDLAGIAASSGSACTAGSIDPSHVLKSMYGEQSPKLRNSIRFSFGVHNSVGELTFIAQEIKRIIDRIKQ